jgi:hypothetical protein
LPDQELLASGCPPENLLAANPPPGWAAAGATLILVRLRFHPREGEVPVRLLLATLLLIIVVPATAPAAWRPQGVRVTGALGDEQLPMVISAAAGGAFIVWGSPRPGPPYDYNGFLQHLNAGGDIAPGWPVDGLLVAAGPGAAAALAPDGRGGTLVLIKHWHR